MIVVFIGAPGSGKGTQASILSKNYGYKALSTGECLRKHVKEETPIGIKVKEIMEKGGLVSDDILLQVLQAELGSKADETILLDGYPRNVEQAKTLGRLGGVHKVALAVMFDLPQELLLSRLTGRRVCSQCGQNFHIESLPSKVSGVCDICQGKLIQRADDFEEKVRTRLELYESFTKPVVDYYRNLGILELVNADRDVAKIAIEVAEIIKKLN